MPKGGESYHNNYFSYAARDGGILGTSTKDGFYATGGNDVQGTLNLSRYKDAAGQTGQKFLVGDSIVDMTVGNTGKIVDALQFVSNTTSSNVKWTMQAGSYYGPSSGLEQAIPDINNVTLSNDYPCLLGNSAEWENVTAIVRNGKTVFQSNSTKQIFQYPDGTDYSGPLNLIGVNLTISDGAVVDNAHMIGGESDSYPKVVIENGGRLENSQLFNGYLKIEEKGYSFQNEYYSVISSTQESARGDILGTVDRDSFYATSGRHITGKLALKNYPDHTSFRVGDDLNDIQNDATGIVHDTRLLNLGDTDYVLELTHGTQTKIPCFLRGTLIETKDGMVAVENIEVGDKVVVYSKEGKTLQPVIWTGHRIGRVDPNLSDDIGGYPVRIVKDALGPNIPFKDLLITAEHCLCLDEQFIPVRMLVNGRSIYYDHSIVSYTYYHIECEKHAVICANGMLTETYLNTGHRQFFLQDEKTISYKCGSKTWEKDAAVPLKTDRTTVEPYFINFLEKAQKLELKDRNQSFERTQNPSLRLLTNQGEIIYPCHKGSKTHFIFLIPSYVKDIRILSRTSRPCDVIGPFVDDRRDLGVLVGRIVLFDRHKKIHFIDQHLQQSDLSGWHSQENSKVRWTKGNGFISLNKYHLDKSKVLVLEIVSAGPYLVKEETVIKKVANLYE